MENKVNALRAKAIELLSQRTIDSEQWGTDVKKLIEELSIYQIELEHQNEALLLSRSETELATGKYVDIFMNAPVSYLIVSPEGMIRQANNMFFRTFHVYIDNMIDSRFDRYIMPIYQDNFYYFFKLLKATKLTTHIDLKMKFKNDVLDVRVEASSLGYSSDLRLALFDMTLQNKLEEKIREEREKVRISEIKFRQIVEQASDVFLYINYNKFCIDYISPGVKEIFGYTQDEILRMSRDQYVDTILPKYRDDYVTLFDVILTNEDNRVEKEFEVKTKQGQVKWIRGSYTLIKTKDNQPQQIIGCLSDITYKKQYEQVLIEARNKAEESDKLKSAFLANMSHEIRTPLNGIIGFADILCNTIESESENYQYVDIIKNCGNRLLSLINNIISVSKIESQQMKVNKCVFNISELLKDTYTMFVPEAKRKGLDLYYESNLMNGDINIETDKLKLTSIIYNLIKNAIKYTDNGKIEFGGKIESGSFKFYVHDTGKGIAKDKQVLIFDRFTQVNETGYNEGVGLGLSITKGFIKLLEGEINLESEVGVGSTFYVSIPIRNISEIDNINGGPIVIPDLSDKYVIVADDDLYSRELLVRYLELSHVKIATATNGEELIQMLRQKIPQYILLDINMPEKGGIECIKEIKKQYDIKIIVESAYALEGSEEQFIALGADGYIAKPISYEDFYRKLGKVIEYKR